MWLVERGHKFEIRWIRLIGPMGLDDFQEGGLRLVDHVLQVRGCVCGVFFGGEVGCGRGETISVSSV